MFNFQLKQLTATKINTVTGKYFDVIIVFSFFLFSFFKGPGRYVRMAKCEYSQLSLRRTPLGPALSVHLIESQIKGVKNGRYQL